MELLQAEATPLSSEIEIRGNAGSRMSFDEGDVVIDLNGIIATMNDGAIPLLYAHDSNDQIGFADSVEVREDGIYLKGKLTMDTKRCANIRNSFKEGQPWQASLGFVIVESREVAEGEEVEVNGRIEAGPVIIAQTIEIKECSIVTFGADSHTEIVRADAKPNTIEAEATVNINAGDELRELDIVADKKGNVMTEELNMNNNTRIASLAVMMQAGADINERNYKEAELEAANQLKDLDFRSIVEAASGWTPTHAQRSSAGEWLQAAASSYGLNNIITTVSGEMLLKYMDSENEPWRQIFRISSCSDQRPSYRYKIGSNGGYDLKKVAAGAEFEHAVYDDAKAVIAADLYARQCVITEEELLAGNAVGALADILRQSAAGAKQCIKNVLYKCFLNPTCQFDSTNFFDASRGNTYSNKALTYANLAEGVAKFYECNQRGVDPRYLVVPASLWATAQTLCKATSFYTASGSGADINPIASCGLIPVAIPDLELAKYGGNYSSTTWYLMADPGTLTAFEATFLNGNTTPRMRRQDVIVGFAGIKFDTSLIFGCASLDPEGIVKFTA